MKHELFNLKWVEYFFNNFVKLKQSKNTIILPKGLVIIADAPTLKPLLV